MRVLIDTNIILDVLCNRSEFARDSSVIWKLCEIGELDGYISALSVSNIVYVLRKELNPQSTKELLGKIDLIFKTEDLKSDDLKKAVDMEYDDYEDALQTACAKRIKAEYIVTRNTKDYKNSTVKAIEPHILRQMHALFFCA